MPLKKRDSRYVAVLMAALGLPDYLPEATIVRETSSEGISMKTFLTLSQEVAVKSYATKLVESVMRQQRANATKLKEWQRQQEQEGEKIAEKFRAGKKKLKPLQLEILDSIRREAGVSLNKLAYLSCQNDDGKRVVFFSNVYFLESCEFLVLRESGTSKVPELTKEGRAQLKLAGKDEVVSRIKQPETLRDWRDLVLATLMVHQVDAEDYGLCRLTKDARAHVLEFEFDLNGLTSDQIEVGLSRGVVELQRLREIEIFKADGRENISLSKGGEPLTAKPVQESEGESEVFEEDEDVPVVGGDSPSQQSREEARISRKVSQIINEAVKGEASTVA